MKLKIGLIIMFSCLVFVDVYPQESVFDVNSFKSMLASGKQREARKYVSDWAYKGDMTAQLFLGVDYEYQKDYEKAIYWFEKAGAQGCGESLFTIGKFYFDGLGVEQNSQKAFEYWLKAAQLGDDVAMVWVGNIYWLGFEVVDVDYYEAFRYYKMAAELGNSDGQYHVGDCYQRGLGVKKDIEKAKEWYRHAAAQGDKRAIEELKNM